MSEIFQALLTGLSDADIEQLERLLGPLRPASAVRGVARPITTLRAAEDDLFEQIRSLDAQPSRRLAG